MPIEFVSGDSPVLLTLPYAGTAMHKRFADRLIDSTQCATAPYRHLGKLLNGLHDDLNVLSPTFHRYLSDVDCVAPDRQLCASKGMVGVVPVLCPKGKSIWRQPPDIREATRWRAIWYAPYHAVLAAHVARIRARFGHAVVITCRARSDNGRLVGTMNEADIAVSACVGAPYSVNFTAEIMGILKTSNRISSHLNRSIATGWMPRQTIRPKAGVQTLNLEVNERCYLIEDEHTGLFDAAAAKHLQDALRKVLTYAANWHPN